MKRFSYLSLAAALTCASLASAQDMDTDAQQDQKPTISTAPARATGADYFVLYSNVSGLPSALVPGMGGLEFNIGTSSSSAFDRPYNSPNGNWILTALMETTTTDDEIILLNNAVVRPMAGYEEGTPEQWADSLRVNITGIHLCTKVFSAGMLERGQGSIVNIGSIYGVFAPDFRIYEGKSFTCPPDYPCHKGAMIAYTKYCATRFASRGVRVNCISPGGYLAGQEEDFLDRYNARIPMGRMAHDEDIAGPVIFLASESSRYITGINLIVDGGLSAW